MAVEVAIAWLDQHGGQQRIPMAIRHLLEATRVAFERGEAAPEKDSLTLSELWRLHRGGDAGPATPLRASEVSRWWSSRENHLAQLLADRGSDLTPRLVVHPGGGRHHTTRFSIAMGPAKAHCDNSSEATEAGAVETNGADGAAPPQTIVYRVDPAKPALWLRLLVGRRPFPIDSWRGYVLLGSAVVNFVLIGLMALVSYLDWSRPRPVSTANLASLALFGLIAAGLWVQTRPIRQLPTRRVTIAGAGYLAMSELYGQLRAMHDADRKAGGRVFSVVRHWAICPICSAEIDLAEGGASFPERLVGRCHDAPAEHVFSFDPVRLVGHPLRAVLGLETSEAVGLWPEADLRVKAPQKRPLD